MLPILIAYDLCNGAHPGPVGQDLDHIEWRSLNFLKILNAVQRCAPRAVGPARAVPGGFHQAIRPSHDPAKDADLNSPPENYKKIIFEEKGCPVDVYSGGWGGTYWVAAKDAAQAYAWGRMVENANRGFNEGHMATRGAQRAIEAMSRRQQPNSQPPVGHVYRVLDTGPELDKVRSGTPGDKFVLVEDPGYNGKSTFVVLHVASGLSIAKAKTITPAKQACAELNQLPESKGRGFGYVPDDEQVLGAWIRVVEAIKKANPGKFW